MGLPAWAPGYGLPRRHVGTATSLVVLLSSPGSLVAVASDKEGGRASGGEASNRSRPLSLRPRPRYCWSSSCRREAGAPATGCWSARAHISRVVAAASGRQLARGQDKSAASQTQLQPPARQQQKVNSQILIFIKFPNREILMSLAFCQFP